MAFYQKRPVVVEALQFDGDNVEEIKKFVGFHKNATHGGDVHNFHRAGTYSVWYDSSIKGEVWDKLHSTWVGVKVGDYIIKGVDGEVYPCNPDVFNRTYDLAEPVSIKEER